MVGHKINFFRRCKFGSEHQIAFILAIFLVYQHHHAPCTHFCNNFLYRCYVCHFLLTFIFQYDFAVAWLHTC